MNQSSVGIIGCGWLGRALAKQLLIQSYSVKATVRDSVKKELLLKEGVDCEYLTVPDDVSPLHNVFQQKTLIVAITPGFKRGKTDYASNIASIVAAAEATKVEKIILVSSTGIYQEHSGNVDEETNVHDVTTSTNSKSSLLVEAERSVLNFSKKGRVLRLSGLVAEDRKPGKFLAGKTNLMDAELPVNLIHRDDCVALLIKLIQQNSNTQDQQIFIGVSQTNANKKQFYTAAALALGLVPPSFNEVKNDILVKRKVYGKKTRQWLNYQYKYDDLLVWLKS